MFKMLLALAACATSSFAMEKPQVTPSSAPPLLYTLISSVGPMMQVKYSSDDTNLISSNGVDHIQVWNTTTYQNPTTINTNIKRGAQLSVNPKRPQCALVNTYSKKGPLRIIDLTTNTILKSIPDGNAASLQYNDEKTLLSGQNHGVCILWDLATSKKSRIFESKEIKGQACNIAINPAHPHQFATVYQDSQMVAIWDSRNEKQPYATTPQLEVPCTTLAYNKKGELAVGGDYNLYIYDSNMKRTAIYDLYGNKMASGEFPQAVVINNTPPYYVPLMPNDITFMPTNDAILIAALDANSVVVYNLEDRTKTFSFPITDGLAPQSVDVTSDGQVMAISGFTSCSTYIYDCSNLAALKAKAKKSEDQKYTQTFAFDEIADTSCSVFLDNCLLQ